MSVSGGGEVAEVGGGVEADQVGAEHALEQLLPGRQGAEQLFGRERDVQEEADPGVGEPAPEQAGHQQQLVVVDPDQVARPVLLRPRPRRSAR